MKDNKLIILCATQRCGSTMIVEDLRNTNVLGKAEEYFIPWDPEREVDWVKNFKDIVKKSQTSNGVSAIKVMANQLEDIEKCLENTDISPSDNHFLPRVRTLFKGAIFIRIKRDNIVRQAVSRVMARKTGVNHALTDISSKYRPGNLLKDNNFEKYNEDIIYTSENIDEEVINIAKESLLWDEVLSDWGVFSPLELHYEQVCKAYPRYLNRISKYLKVEVDLTLLPKRRNIKKLSNINNEKIVAEYLLG